MTGSPPMNGLKAGSEVLDALERVSLALEPCLRPA